MSTTTASKTRPAAKRAASPQTPAKAPAKAPAKKAAKKAAVNSNTTAKANATADIDLSTGRPSAELDAKRSRGPGAWRLKLDNLLTQVESGKAKLGVAYLLGKFTSPAGAHTARINVLRDERGFIRPANFKLVAVVQRENGQRLGSELWASVEPDATAPESAAPAVKAPAVKAAAAVITVPPNPNAKRLRKPIEGRKPRTTRG